MDRKVRDRIFDEIKLNGKLEKDYVVQLIKTYDERPDVNKLIEQNYKSKADRIIASFKDENGIRDCFAIKDSQNNTKYIDISKPNLLTKGDIDIVRDKQIKLRKKKEEIIKKVAISQKVIMGQIQIEDYNKALKEELRREVI